MEPYTDTPILLLLALSNPESVIYFNFSFFLLRTNQEYRRRIRNISGRDACLNFEDYLEKK